MGHGITHKDSMIYVGETPWHRLGVRLDAPPTAAEAIKAAGLDWTIRTEQIYHGVPVIGEDGAWSMRRVAAPGQVVLRNDTSEILGTVGLRWTPVQNVDAFRWLDRWLDTGKIEIETAGSLWGGRKVWILARIKSDPIVVGRDDEVGKFVLIALAHDGTMAIRLGLTLVRVVCANTLGFAIDFGDRQAKDGDERLFSVSHTSRVLDRMESVADKIEAIDSRLTAVGEAYGELGRRNVQGKAAIADYVAAVYQQTPEQVASGRRLGAITELFEGGVGQDMPSANGTYWGLYNALTEYETHGSGKRAGQRNSQESRADRNVLGSGAKLLARGLDVALVMGRGYTIGEVFGEFSDVAVSADLAHPDVALAG